MLPPSEPPPPAAHGAPDHAELEALGLIPDDVLDFSVNSSAYGPSPAALRALQTVDISRYPDREALALRRALGVRFGLPPEQIVCGAGTAELLWLAAFALLRGWGRTLIAGPTFGEYARCAGLLGTEVIEVRAEEGAGFWHSPQAISQALTHSQPDACFICNPNNPSGGLLPAEHITGWAADFPQTLFIIDEAYMAFTEQNESVMAAGLPNLLVLRSLTKDYALAGLRIGFAAGPPALVGAVAAVRPPWNVSGPAQAAALAAIGDEAHLQRSLAGLRAAKTDLLAGLAALGYLSLPSATHYFLLKVGDGAGFRARLMRQRIQVRDCASFGLPEYVRIATRRPEENHRLLAALTAAD